jgi:MYXO-CTERM domain-containing protein
MTIKTTSLAAFGAALLAVGASGAVAQSTTTTDPALSTDTTMPMDDNDGDEGKWGLLGLLGLAGLLGLKKRDNDHRHTNNTTGTGTGTGTR